MSGILLFLSMSRRDRPELWRCEVCWPPCGDAGRCRRAHALQDLLPPVEAVHLFDGRWSVGGVDRWYSQDLTEEQLKSCFVMLCPEDPDVKEGRYSQAFVDTD